MQNPPLAVLSDVHGTPEKNNEYFLQEVLAGGLRLRTEAQLAQMLKSHLQPLLLCGHDHIPAFVRLSDGRHIINPGSVGLPAYRDHTPFLHAMETAALTAAKNCRLDWAGFLRSGRAGA